MDPPYHFCCLSRVHVVAIPTRAPGCRGVLFMPLQGPRSHKVCVHAGAKYKPVVQSSSWPCLQRKFHRLRRENVILQKPGIHRTSADAAA